MSCSDIAHRRSQGELQNPTDTSAQKPQDNPTMSTNVSADILNFMTPPPPLSPCCSPLTLYGEH